jgi:polyribonucleotide nucleotidyltransferase
MALWEYYATGITNAMRTTPTVFVSHNALLADPVNTVQRLFEDLQSLEVRGLEMPSEKEITTFIDPSLYRSHGSEEAIGNMVTGYQQQLISYVTGQEATPEQNLVPTELAADLTRSLNQQLEMQEKMEAQNHRYSELAQRNYELESQLESSQHEQESVREHYQRLLDKERADMQFMQSSTSWKVGHRIVRTLRTLTFRSNPA